MTTQGRSRTRVLLSPEERLEPSPKVGTEVSEHAGSGSPVLQRFGPTLEAPARESGLVSEVVRAVRDEDLPVLREIERASGERYREFGLDQVADDEPASIEVLADYASGGRAWVAQDADGAPVGYILVDAVDGAAHIEQVSVAPDHQGRGLGRALVERAAQWAAGQDMNALTLTTFGHIPWNRPLYEHLGFRVLAYDELGPGMRAAREAEAAHGLDPALRVVMRRDLDRTPGAQG